MDDLSTHEKPRPRPFTIVAGGCLVMLCLLLIAGTILFGYQQSVIRRSPTATPTSVPTPYLIREPVDPRAVMKEDFSSNKNDWSLYYPNGKLEVINGKLVLQSNVQNGFVIGESKRFFPSGETYYLQADFTTDVEKAYPFGLIFGFNESLSSYYLFEITPQTEYYRLLKFNSGKWDELISYSQNAINPYPQVNTLSVYFDKGNMELYINGDVVSTFLDKDLFRSSGVGVFVSNSGYRLIVDDFFIYGEK